MQVIPAASTPQLIWNVFREGKNLKQSGYTILNWRGHSVAGISVLAFVCIRHDTFVIRAAATATQAAAAQTSQWLLFLLYISRLTASTSKGPQLPCSEDFLVEVRKDIFLKGHQTAQQTGCHPLPS
jgi:hypothetical protein